LKRSWSKEVQAAVLVILASVEMDIEELLGIWRAVDAGFAWPGLIVAFD